MTETLTVDQLVSWIDDAKEVMRAHQDELTKLDSAIGDADHGANMARGTEAAAAALEATPPTTIAEFGKAVGMALISKVGGASGPLYGTFFLRFGASGGAAETLDGAGLAAALGAGIDGIVARGKAEVGDKTMLDALIPARDAASGTSGGVSEVAAAAAAAAAGGRDSTEPLVAKKGRASYLGERSAGHLDPGAVSATLLLDSLAKVLA